MALSTPPTAPQRGDRATFASRVDAFITWLIGFVSELNVFSSNLNSIAAGGAYSIPYKFSAQTGDGDPGSGYLRLNGTSTQLSSTAMYIDLNSSVGSDVSFLLDQLAQSTSAVKSTLRLVKQNDAGTFLVFDVTSITSPAGYRGVFMSGIAGSSASPFQEGDSILLFFQRTGDKGDAGSLTPVLWVRDEKASGQGGGNAGAGTAVTRTLNTIKKNSISGASVASNQITLPAGTYRVSFSAPGYNVAGHQAYLYNVTDASVAVLGTGAYVSGTVVETRSGAINAEIVLTATKVFEVRHWTNTGTVSTGLGFMSSTGLGEVYTEVFIEKVS